MSPEEKAKLSKNDEVDQIHTSEIENEVIDDINFDFLERHNVNLARAFLGYDGGFSMRKLKKLVLAEKKHNKSVRDAYNKRMADQEA
jgi:hypothetical protein